MASKGRHGLIHLRLSCLTAPSMWSTACRHHLRPQLPCRTNDDLQAQCRRWQSTQALTLDSLISLKTQEGKESKKLAAPNDDNKLPTVLAQADANMKKYEGCVLLTRVGSFYELYFAQAEKYAPLLNLKLAKKWTSKGPIPMAGFPFTQMDRYLKILVQDMHEYVAISEEFPNTPAEKAKSNLLFDRRVTRTVTPGTLIDEKFMDQFENNFLLALSSPESLTSQTNGSAADLDRPSAPGPDEKRIGLAWVDLSTGEFFTQEVSLQGLASTLARISAREIVVHGDSNNKGHKALLQLLEQQRQFVTHYTPAQNADINMWNTSLESKLSSAEQQPFSEEEVAAGSLLISYVRNRVSEASLKLQMPVRKEARESMLIDKHSMRALEVLTTSKDAVVGGKGSLLHTIRRTTTKSGARLLRDWISSPSMSLEVINARLNLASLFLREKAFREEIIAHLKGTFDSQRLVQKFSLGRGDEDDLLSLCKTIEATKYVRDLLDRQVSALQGDSSNQAQLSTLRGLRDRLSLDGPDELQQQILAAIDEDGLLEFSRQRSQVDPELVSTTRAALETEGLADDVASLDKSQKKSAPKKDTKETTEPVDVWIMQRSASTTLNKQHEKLAALKKDKIALTAALQESLGAKTLTLRWTPGLGFICHVKTQKDVNSSMKQSEGVRDVKTTKSTRSFHHTEWTKLGQSMDQTKARIRGEEHRILQGFCIAVVKNLVKLRQNGRVLDELDIGCSSATVAEEQGYVRPVVNNSLNHRITGGRHPTVIQGLEEQGRAFISNDCHLGEQERIWFITGPNMAGKSTFLRQNALISILAQAGSFVPADSAEIGLVDQIFTRVGSADNLFRDQSTFMVEMIETAAILHQATPQSFVIMDEIGRGTTPEDGVAIGFACLHHLYHKNRSRTLFASHFHALADMAGGWDSLGCYCTDIEEGKGNTFSFVHRLRPGVNRSSHALKVAALAGVPAAAIDTARSVLENLKNSDVEERQQQQQQQQQQQAAAAA